MSFGLAAYSFPFGCGFAQRDGRGAPRPMDARALAALATAHGLSGVETPLLGMLPGLSPDAARRFGEELRAGGLSLVVDTPVIEEELLAEVLPLAALAGARVVRAMLSSVLEGARADFPGGWGAYLEQMRGRIARIAPLLEEHDLSLALENHQDATSEELLALCEAGGPRVGVTLDVANPLAVGEEPLAFARAVGPRILNVHLKDYRIFPTPSGYELVRCALGEGAIPIPAILRLLDEVAPHAPRNIELAALHGRHIRLLEDGWWEGYPPRDARALLPALRLAAAHAQPPDAERRTPWERGAPYEEVERYELRQFEASVRYLRSDEG